MVCGTGHRQLLTLLAHKMKDFSVIDFFANLPAPDKSTSACQVLTPVQDARMLAEAYPAAPDIVQLSMLVAHELRDPSADYSFASLPAPDMGGLPPPGLSALSALPYVPAPQQHLQHLQQTQQPHQRTRKPEMLRDNTVTTGILGGLS